ncbi:hypothetical protein COX85_02515 [Candidatus Micrarchaeota archaeon CG_4_10_14_0_2_um_filter_55_9]|nr:MAG: hypothetical protein COX85_02515 [Candidatus Micrarchaeota archaeon CG_4_10_14_0_2_um_filter_55_9]
MAARTPKSARRGIQMLTSATYLAATLALGLAVADRVLPKNNLIAAYPLGMLASTWAVFLASLALGFNEASIIAASTLCLAAAYGLHKKKAFQPRIQKQLVPLAIISLLAFAAIHYATFHYSNENLNGIPTDFGFHHGIITSLANKNFPPENPFYAGEPFNYYYFNHLHSATLLKGGLPLQAASLLPQILVNASLVALLYLLAKKFFPKKRVLPYVFIAIFLLNGTLVFLENQAIINEFIQSTFRNSGYPFETILMSVLLLGRVASVGIFIVILTLLKKENAWLLGLLPMFHLFSFVLGFAYLACYALFFERKKIVARAKQLALPAAMAAPQLAFLLLNNSAANSIRFQLGWLSAGQDPASIAVFWFNNLGPYLFLGALGYYTVKNDEVKKVFLALLPPAILANLFIFTPYDWDNFKFFVFFFLGLCLLAAYGLDWVWNKKTWGKILAVALFLVMIASGIMALTTLLQHSDEPIYTARQIQQCKWIDENTPKDAVFAIQPNSINCIYSLAGRKVFLGFEEWVRNHGLDFDARIRANEEFLNGNCFDSGLRSIWIIGDYDQPTEIEC